MANSYAQIICDFTFKNVFSLKDLNLKLLNVDDEELKEMK